MSEATQPQDLMRRSADAFAASRYDDAAIYARAALEAFRDQPDALGAARAMTLYGSAQAQQSQYRQALSTLGETIRKLTELERPDLTGQAHNHLALVHRELGDPEAAFHHFGRALEAARALRDRELEGEILAHIGDAYLAEADADSALPNLQAAVGVLEHSDDPSRLGWAQGAIGRLHLARGELEDAGDWLERARATTEQGVSKRCVGEVVCAWGDYLCASDRHDEAVEAFQRALDIAGRLRIRREICRAHEGLARVYEAIGDTAEALIHFKRFHTVNSEIVDDVARVKLRNLSAELELQRAQLEKEQSHLRNAELEETLENVERLSILDPLTNCYNRRYLDMCLVKEYKRSRRHGTPLTLAMADADRFKAINDAHSHAVGDYVLAMLSEIIGNVIRSEDVLARFGGEEFVLLFPDTDLDGGVLACDKIRRAIESYPWENTAEDLAVTMSFGVASAEGTENWSDILEAADGALYAAKSAGRNRVEAAAPLAAGDEADAPPP